MKNSFRSLLKSNSLLLLFCLCLSACSADSKKQPAIFDPQINLSREEIRKVMVKDKKDKIDKISSNQSIALPKLSKMLSMPAPPDFVGNKVISFAVTEQISLKDVLIELGRAANIDIDIDPTISGGIIINAKNRPFKEVLDRIADRGNLRYSYKDGVLHFERDLPYSEHYIVDYLVDGTLWADVVNNITQIIAESSNSSSSFSSGVGSSSGTGASTTSTVSANKSAGVITVVANSKKQKHVATYLTQVKRNASAQVLIEAKLVEVTLDEKYKAGIDWGFINGGQNISQSTAIATTSDPAPVFSLALGQGSRDLLSTTINALKQFGDIRAISSPRINALNNQKAILSFIDQLIYFTVTASTSTTTSSSTSDTVTTITGTKNEVDVGTKLTITPSIDLNNNEIILSVNPEISVQNGTVDDPTVNPETGESLGNTVPIIQTRSLTTTMKIASGSTLVIGGLMKENTTNTDKETPFLWRIPLLGYLFRQVSKDSEIVETVIFIKATIINPSDGVGEYDRKFHDNFDSNKRPFI